MAARSEQSDRLWLVNAECWIGLPASRKGRIKELKAVLVGRSESADSTAAAAAF